MSKQKHHKKNLKAIRMEHERQLEKERLQIRENFNLTLKKICNAYGGEGTYELISDMYLTIFYFMRNHSYKVKAAPNENIKDTPIKQINKILSNALNDEKLIKLPNGEVISCNDYLTIFLTIQKFIKLFIYDKENSEKREAWTIEFCERLDIMLQEEATKEADSIMVSFMTIFIIYLNDLTTRLIWFKTKYEIHEKKYATECILELHRQTPNVKYVCIDHEYRKVYQLSMGIFEVGITHAKLRPIELGFMVKNMDELVDVYVQSHALHRLYERLDGVDQAWLRVSMHTSINKYKTIIPIDNERALIDFYIDLVKVGYLVCTYVDGIIVIKTFLFITNEGTPEGDKLRKLTGLGILDKSYLGLGKLSSFINSDISSNEKLKSIFEQAGCQSIVNIDASVMNISNEKENKHIADKILKYLNTEVETIEWEGLPIVNC